MVDGGNLDGRKGRFLGLFVRVSAFALILLYVCMTAPRAGVRIAVYNHAYQSLEIRGIY